MKVEKPRLTSDVGMRIAELRREKGLRQKDVADITGYDQCSISNWEKGVRNLPLHALLVLAEAFQVPTGYILGDETRAELQVRQDEAKELQALRRLVVVQKYEIEDLKASIKGLNRGTK